LSAPPIKVAQTISTSPNRAGRKDLCITEPARSASGCRLLRRLHPLYAIRIEKSTGVCVKNGP
jgi:hypothetical protein